MTDADKVKIPTKNFPIKRIAFITIPEIEAKKPCFYLILGLLTSL